MASNSVFNDCIVEGGLISITILIHMPLEQGCSNAWFLQLLAVACVSLAAKLEEVEVPLLLNLQVIVHQSISNHLIKGPGTPPLRIHINLPPH